MTDSAEERTPAEDEYTAVFAAEEEALIVGRSCAAGTPTQLPADLHQRLAKDLACAKLLHRALHGVARPISEPSSDLPWTHLGRYELRRELGRGGCGVVYLAYDPRLNRHVALKVPRAEVAVTPSLRERFHREARAAAGLDHANLVPVYEVGEVGPVCFLVSAYCPGVTLAQLLKNHRDGLAIRDAAQLVATLADAVQHAHARGVVHRDLKPGNVLLQPDQQTLEADKRTKGQGDKEIPSGFSRLTPKITDFGLAKFLLEGSGQTLSETILGTPAYMAPEQAAGKAREVGPAADIYALGVILYEIVTGRPPFCGESDIDTLHQVRNDEPLAPSSLRPKVPSDLEVICLKCLQKEPGQRYATAGALAGDLRRFLAGEPIKARPVGRVEKLWRWCRRHPREAGLATAVVLLLAAGSVISTLLAAWALTEKARAEGEQETANQERDAAQIARDLAEEGFLLANQAVEDYLTKVAEDPELKRHGQHALRKKLLESAIPFYEKFTEQKPGDPKQELARGRAFHRLALIYEEMGERPKALAHYQQMQAVFQQLARDFPDVPGYRRDLAGSHNNVANMLRDVGQRPAAEAEHRLAIRLQKQLVDEFAAERPYRQDLAASHQNLGRVLREQGRKPEAGVEYRAALALRKKLADQFPAMPECRRDLARSHNSLGLLLRELGQKPEALEEHRAAIALQKQLVEEFVTVAEYRQELAQSHNNLGVLLAEMQCVLEAEAECRKALALQKALADQFPAVAEYRRQLAHSHQNLGGLLGRERRSPAAEAESRHALALLRELAEKFPDVPDYESELGSVLNNLATILRDAGDLDQAGQLLEEAIVHQQKAMAVVPQQPSYRRSLRNHYRGLCEVRLRQRDHAKTAAAARELAKVRPEVPRDAYDAACYLACAIPRAATDVNLSEDERSQLGASYGNEAMEALRFALHNGFQDVGLLKTDQGLAPLRSREDFQKLVIDVEQKQKAGNR